MDIELYPERIAFKEFLDEATEQWVSGKLKTNMYNQYLRTGVDSYYQLKQEKPDAGFDINELDMNWEWKSPY